MPVDIRGVHGILGPIPLGTCVPPSPTVAQLSRHILISTRDSGDKAPEELAGSRARTYYLERGRASGLGFAIPPHGVTSKTHFTMVRVQYWELACVLGHLSTESSQSVPDGASQESRRLIRPTVTADGREPCPPCRPRHVLYLPLSADMENYDKLKFLWLRDSLPVSWVGGNSDSVPSPLESLPPSLKVGTRAPTSEA